MPSYIYVAIDQKGKEQKGSIEALSESKALESLKSEGFIPISVKSQNIWNKEVNLAIGTQVKPRDMSVFCRQFVSILNAGVTIISALQMLSEETENKAFKPAIKEVQIAVEKGETLADAMRSQDSKIFPSILTQMVEAGESSGSLEIAFERMAIHFEKDAKLKAMIRKAMIYPIVVGLVAVGVIFAMMVKVVPNFVVMFNDMDMELPAVTKMVIYSSNFFVKWWFVMIAVFIIGVLAIREYKKTPKGSEVFGRIGLKIPIFGKLTIKSSCARLARNLSTLIAAGIPLIEAIDITSKTISNVILRKVLINAKEEVERGGSLSIQLEKSGEFPPLVYHMLRIGEETGNIEAMLDKLAEYYDEEVEVTTQTLTAAMEPLIIVVLALIVGFLIMAIMTPMMSIYSGIEKM